MGGLHINIIIIIVVVTFSLNYHHYHLGLLDRDGGSEPCRGSQLYGTIGTGVAYLISTPIPVYPNTSCHLNPAAQTCDPISLGSSPPSDIYSPLHIRPPQCLLAAADAKPSWRGGRSHWGEKLGICSICSVQPNFSRRFTCRG